MKLIDSIQDCDNSIVVRLEKDGEDVYSGSLSDIPADYHECEVWDIFRIIASSKKDNADFLIKITADPLPIG